MFLKVFSVSSVISQHCVVMHLFSLIFPPFGFSVIYVENYDYFFNFYKRILFQCIFFLIQTSDYSCRSSVVFSKQSCIVGNGVLSSDVVLKRYIVNISNICRSRTVTSQSLLLQQIQMNVIQNAVQ